MLPIQSFSQYIKKRNLETLKNGGTSGTSGTDCSQPNETAGLFRTPCSPIRTTCTTHANKASGTVFSTSGTDEVQQIQGLRAIRTTVPPVPLNFNDFKRSENDGNVNNDLTTAERFDLWQKVEIRRLINELCDTAPHSQLARKEMLNSIAGLSSTGVPQAFKLYRRCLAQVANGSYWSFKDNELH